MSHSELKFHHSKNDKLSLGDDKMQHKKIIENYSINQVQWTAPLTSGKGCLVFRSTVIEHRDVWFMDDGALSKTLCEDEADASDIEPFIINECKACDEAKYELTFEGLWSRQRYDS